MPRPGISELFAQYPAVIAQMKPEFTSHKFILCLARQNQRDYAHALASYADVRRAGTPTPFMTVHSILARHLNTFVPQLIVQDGPAIDPDIFGDPCSCAKWRKIGR